MNSDMFWWGFYGARRRRLRRQHQQEMAALEARLRAELGLVNSDGTVTILAAPRSVPRPRRQVHLGRWVLLAVAVLVLLLGLAFVAYLVVFGLQHGYIYPAHTHG